MTFRTPTNKEMSVFMGQAWNGWFVRWRDKAETMPDNEWLQCVDELDEIIYPVHDCLVAVEIARSLLMELERRREAAQKASV